jgi:hypothetical protein
MLLADHFKVKDDCGEGYIKVKVIKKMLKLRVNCTPEGRKICQGACCKNKGALYEQTELFKLPDDLRGLLKPIFVTKPTYMRGRLIYAAPVINGQGCAFKDICMKNPIIKPVMCWLSPLRLIKRGDDYTLEFSHEKFYHCPMFGQGEEAWITLKDDIIHALGEEAYRQIEEGMKKLGDEPFYICIKKWF